MTQATASAVTVERSFESANSKTLGVSDEMTGHITDLLATFYESGPYGCIREQVSNGVDAAHNKGVTPQVDITLDGDLSDSLQVIIKDNGIGMSPEVFTDRFAALGESTKRDTLPENERTGPVETGMFGVGAKSWLAIGDTATTLTVNAGIKTLGIFTKDEEDRVRFDTIPMGETDEPSGTTITIPLRDREQKDDILKAVRRVGAIYPAGWVSLNSVPVASIYSDDNEGILRLTEDCWVFDNYATHSFLPNDRSNFWVIQGGIVYPIPREWVDENITTLEEAGFNMPRRYWGARGTIVVEVPNKSLRPVPQRDGLRDTRANRNKAVEMFVERALAGSRKFQESLDEETYVDAIAMRFHDAFNKRRFTWRGKSLDNDIALRDTERVWVKYQGSTISKARTISISGYKNMVIYRGITPEDTTRRKFIMDVNARLRSGVADHIYVYLTGDEDVPFSQDWCEILTDDVTVDHTVTTAEEVFAVNARSVRAPSQSVPVTYDLYTYDAEGNQTWESVSVSEIPEDVFYVQDENDLRVMTYYKVIKNTQLILLRPRQQVEAFTRRVPTAQPFSIASTIEAHAEEELTDDLVLYFHLVERTYNFRSISRRWNAVRDLLPETSSTRGKITRYAELTGNSEYGEKARKWRQLAQYSSIVNTRLDDGEEDTPWEALENSFPLVQSLQPYQIEENEPIREHVKKYVLLIEQDMAETD